MIFEGVVINRIHYKERDLITKLLMRNGLVGSFYVYGGQGGGKSQKPSSFELGSMMRIMIKEQRTRIEVSELMVSVEYQQVWKPQLIRHDIKAFYLLCFYFELVQKFTITYHHCSSDLYYKEDDGIFSVVSNAIY